MAGGRAVSGFYPYFKIKKKFELTRPLLFPLLERVDTNCGI